MCVPSLTINLLSIGKLLKNGYKFEFDNGKCTIIEKKKNITVAKVMMNLYNKFPLTILLGKKITFQRLNDDDLYLW